MKEREITDLQVVVLPGAAPEKEGAKGLPVPEDLATIVLSNGEAVHRIVFNNNYDLTGGSLNLGNNPPFTITPRMTTAP